MCLDADLKLGQDLVYPCWDELLKVFGVPSERSSHSTAWRLRFYPYANFLVSRHRVRQFSHSAYLEIYRRVVLTGACRAGTGRLSALAPFFVKDTLAGGTEHLASVIFGNQLAEGAPAAALPSGPENCSSRNLPSPAVSSTPASPRRHYIRQSARSARCTQWQPVLPPTASDVSRWVVHDGMPSNGGLGDYLASLTSAFLLAVMTRRRFYVKPPFGNLTDFSPYNVPPPDALSSGIVISDRFVSKGRTYGCLRPDELRQRLEGNLTAKGRIIFFRGQHRACASTWAPMLSPLWHALVGRSEATFADMEQRVALLYGCILRMLFKPGPAVADVLDGKTDLSAGAEHTVGVHMRFGDYYRLRPTHSCAAVTRTEQSSRVSAFVDGLVQLRSGALLSERSVRFRVEADDICVRNAIIRGLQARGMHVAPPIAADAGTRLGAGNLAAWFAFAASDTFALLPLCEQWGTRLSGWSSMALLHANRQSFYRICDVYARRPLCATARTINCSSTQPNVLLARRHNGSEREHEVRTGKQALAWTVANFE